MMQAPGQLCGPQKVVCKTVIGEAGGVRLMDVLAELPFDVAVRVTV
jgi:hypothetical protein